MKQRDVSVWQEERAKEFCEEWYKTQVKKDHKIVVIDDDPTGTQTVHDVPVYTAYDLEHIRKGFKEETSLFYVLTNSRSLKQKETEKLHLQLGRDIAQAAKEQAGRFYLKRSLSTGNTVLKTGDGRNQWGKDRRGDHCAFLFRRGTDHSRRYPLCSAKGRGNGSGWRDRVCER